MVPTLLVTETVRSMVPALLLLCLLALVGLGWHDSMRARESATALCRDVCRSYQAQFLDDTVALAHLGLTLGGDRRLRIRRVYQFEITYDGAVRRIGSVTMVGHAVQSIFVPEGPDG